MSTKSVSARTIPAAPLQALLDQGVDPVLAPLFAARGVQQASQLEYELKHLAPWQQLLHVEAMARRLADAIAQGQRLLVIADYDSDGATACALAMRGLSAMGAIIDFLVPNRFEYGYGLTPEIVALAATRQPDILLTVDNGIASAPGVEAARALGIEVLVTDHHLAGDTLPDCLIVNPNQPGCPFPSKAIAGVGVMFYVLIALRAELRQRGVYPSDGGPNLAQWLDLVALGTVADVVRLDDNNRILVQQGLQRMRRGLACAGIRALFEVGKRTIAQASCQDLGFTLGPRLNAAGRLDDMSLGIACLLSDDDLHALTLAGELNQLNQERRQIEGGMQDEALLQLDHLAIDDAYGLALYHPDWHQGVIGIVASRIKDRYHRPVFTFAPGQPGELKGSGRSISSLHLRDAIDLIAKRHPDLVLKFGGHAMAAGLTIREDGLATFQQAFAKLCAEQLQADDLQEKIWTDGELPARHWSLNLADTLNHQVWGQGFPPPQFQGVFRVLQQRVLKDAHTKLTLDYQGQQVDAIYFRNTEPLPNPVQLVYQLDINEYRGERTLQLRVSHHGPVEAARSA